MTTFTLPTRPRGLIQRPEELNEFCAHLADAGLFAYDTEFIGETTYHPILCLVQVATAHRVALIDSMALTDLSPLWDLMADPKIIKICHAGDQDLAIAWHLSGKMPRRVFDTQIGAGLAGLGYPLAYWRVVDAFCHVQLEKSQTYSSWDRRPLSREQFEYAIDDVAYLPTVYERLSQQLSEYGNQVWMEKACDELCEQAASPGSARQIFARIKGAVGMAPLELAGLRELAAWREQLAWEHDLPPRSLVKDEALLDLVHRWPRDFDGVERVGGLHPADLETYADQVLDLLERAKALPAKEHPTLPPPLSQESAELKRLSETLWAAAQVICLGHHVTPALACSQAQVTAMARALVENQDLTSLVLMQGWVGECLGRPLLELYQGSKKGTVSMNPPGHLNLRWQ